MTTRWMVLAAAIVMTAAPASAQINPFPNNAQRFDDAERAQMYAAMRTVLESREVGTTATWASEEGHVGGMAELVRVYTRDGLRCGEVRHEFRDLREGDDLRPQIPFYNVLACEVPGEGWKLAF